MVLWKYWAGIYNILIIFNESLEFLFKTIDKQLFRPIQCVIEYVYLVDMNED